MASSPAPSTISSDHSNGPGRLSSRHPRTAHQFQLHHKQLIGPSLPSSASSTQPSPLPSHSTRGARMRRRSHVNSDYFNNIIGHVGASTGIINRTPLSSFASSVSSSHVRPDSINTSHTETSATAISSTSTDSLDDNHVKPPTIRDILQPYVVPMQVLDSRYHHLLALTRCILGVAPNSDCILEIFPPAFTTYNLLVPNFINLPFQLWGISCPIDLVSMATYYAARSAQCAYCSMHTCSFALRRGVDKAALTGDRTLTKRETAVVEVALNMSSFPHHLTDDDRLKLYHYLSPSHVEWIVLAISMVGFLTTFMNSLGVDMEQTAVSDVEHLLKKTGWSEGKHVVTPSDHPLQDPEDRPLRGDTLFSNLSMLRHIPSAIQFDVAATKKIPKSWPAIGDYLMVTVGHSFPVLGLLKHGRAVRALAEIIRMNLDAIECGIDPDIKYLVGIVFAGVNGNRLLGREFRKMTMLMVDYLDETMIDAVEQFAKEDTDFSVDYFDALGESALVDGVPLSEEQVRLMYVAKACCFVPSRTTRAVVEASKEIRPSRTVELLCWVSILSLLHKLYVFYYPSCTERVTLTEAQLGERVAPFTKILPRVE